MYLAIINNQVAGSFPTEKQAEEFVNENSEEGASGDYVVKIVVAW